MCETDPSRVKPDPQNVDQGPNSREVRSVIKGMSTPLRSVLSENVRKIVGGMAVHSWSARHGIDKKMVQRLVNDSTAATIETVEKIAHAAKVRPWQLLVDGFDPEHPSNIDTATSARGLVESRPKWPFPSVPESVVARLSERDQGRLEAALFDAAERMGLRLKPHDRT